MTENKPGTEGMEAGAEMDRLINERVMGWHLAEHTEHYKALEVYRRDMGWFDGERFLFWHDAFWSPSKNDIDAIRVLTHLDSKGYHLVLVNCPGCDEQRAKGWACDVIAPNEEDGAISVHAETLQLAICRAALLALPP